MNRSQRLTGRTKIRRDVMARISCMAILGWLLCLTEGFPDQPARTAIASTNFWSYQPLRSSKLPEVRDGAWPRTGIDRFILARLEKAGLPPAADADAETLIRRIYYDLIGLPPASDSLDTLDLSTGPEGMSHLIDRLLARPQFGERWGRHWLDVARFGESVTLRGLIFKEAWRYRDYVVESFNRDLSYDEFIRQQIAGDLLPAPELIDKQRQLVATTFLALGNWNLEEQDKAQLRMDVVDEQLDVIGKAFLGQTISCARCHDHKFDPIPTRDYYALAGILRSCKTLIDANVSGWVERPLPVDDETETHLRAHETRLADARARIKTAKESLARASANLTPSADKPDIVVSADLPGIVVDDTQARKVGNWRISQYSSRYIGAGYAEDRNTEKGKKTITFQAEVAEAGKYEVRLAYNAAPNRARNVPVTILSAEGEKVVHVDQQQIPSIEGRFISLGIFRFEQNGQGFVLISNEGTVGHVIADAVQFLAIESTPVVVGAGKVKGESKPAQGLADGRAAAANDLKRLELDLKALIETGPKRPLVMAPQDENPADTAVHRRGSVHNLGEPVARGFLQVARLPGGSIPAAQSGRVELAEWLVHPSNPLTARVMVNRVWHWLFGVGLVRTPDNFGTTGEAPSHPELLDYLADQLIRHDWSLKWLIREIMSSRTYQLSSRRPPKALVSDPENRLLSGMNRRRLDAECLRDTMLLLAGRLRLDMGGPTIAEAASADYGYRYDEPRRTVYVPALRNALLEVVELFDGPDPSVVTGGRNRSTVAPQALYLLNHPFVGTSARQAAQHWLARSSLGPDELLDFVYRLALGRAPTAEEQRVSRIHLTTGDTVGDVEAWTQLWHALFASLDFRYVE